MTYALESEPTQGKVTATFMLPSNPGLGSPQGDANSQMLHVGKVGSRRAAPGPQKATGNGHWKQNHTKLGTTHTVRENGDQGGAVT